MKRLLTSFMALTIGASLFTSSASFATGTDTLVNSATNIMTDAAANRTDGFCRAAYATAMQGGTAVKDAISLGVKYPAQTGACISIPYAIQQWYAYLMGVKQQVTIPNAHGTSTVGIDRKKPIIPTLVALGFSLAWAKA